ncbi:T9SS type B sorting domain-containing protein [Flavobacterium rakeshii]|uniref:T9SS type B sorting domain-containing protein n=1 Tax=Flavobacterium rakeshii TaxID=1038845 RepID=UPI002E7B10ED|nr:T9SS type B sorting domain-containing protein [Flavobacterium rakeshii]MEE1898916.1 T9SS type B sorting domain-containing protein [Flavobacterium rakeshii]
MKKHLTFLVLLSGLYCYSQAEASNWYFARYAGLKFLEDGTVVTLLDSQMTTYEGSSSISDFNGNLLFYTDGKSVWDKNHVIMPNADYDNGTGLLGDPSSTQSGIIIPKKGNPNIYYVFTVDEPHDENAETYPDPFPGPYQDGNTIPSEDDGLNNGLNYSVVDLSITGANGSAGDVISRNNHLITYNPESDEARFKCSEKISAVKDASDNGYWIVTQFTNRFYAFHIDENGVNETPVISSLNPSIPTTGYRRNAIGYMKISPNGKKIAVAHSQRATQAGTTTRDGAVYLYDFNNATGVVSNPIALVNEGNPYGIEFSPQSKKLYVTFESIYNTKQFDLESNGTINSYEINASGKALQLAPNGKIYIAQLGSDSLGVINDPDETDFACNPGQGPNLGEGRFSAFGLPPFITSFLEISIEISNACLGEESQIEMNIYGNIDSIMWDFGDGSPTTTQLNPTHTYTTPGNYTIAATITRGIEEHTYSREIVITEIPVANPVGDLYACDPENNGTESFDLSQNTADILGSQSPDDFEVLYFDSLNSAENNSNPLPEAYESTQQSQIIYARVHSKFNADCYDITTFSLHTTETPIIQTHDENYLCIENSTPLTINAGTNSSQFTYLWSTGETTSSINVNEMGTYEVEVTNSSGCSKTRTVTIYNSQIPTIQNIEINDLIENNTVTVYVSSQTGVNTTYYYSLDLPNGPFQESNFFENVQPGLHTVYVTDAGNCGITKKEISILSIPKFFTPNGDGVHDTWDIVGMNIKFYSKSSIYIFDRYGKLLTSVDPKGAGWDGTYNGHPLPSTDYWYLIKLDDGRVIKGHFSMIR